MTMCGVHGQLQYFKGIYYRVVKIKIDYLRAVLCCLDDAKLKGTVNEKEEFIMSIMRTIPNFSRNIPNGAFFKTYIDYNKLDISVDFENAIELFEMGGIL